MINYNDLDDVYNKQKEILEEFKRSVKLMRYWYDEAVRQLETESVTEEFMQDFYVIYTFMTNLGVIFNQITSKHITLFVDETNRYIDDKYHDIIDISIKESAKAYPIAATSRIILEEFFGHF